MCAAAARRLALVPDPKTYEDAGVDYETLDAGKRLALDQALATSGLLAAHGARALDASRGEPAFAFEMGGQTFAFVVEGLGTKAMIARAVGHGFGAVAYDTVAAIANDLCCVGALPLVINAYFATGSSDWYEEADRNADLLDGWRRGCEDAGATWGGGESPSLPELVADGEIELAGAAMGLVPGGGSAILGDELAPGDEIVLVGSTGLHANGASLARLLARECGYDHVLPGGESFGAALLRPSAMYVPLVRELLAADAGVHYLSHITGHGFLKLMRPKRDLTYRITAVPDVPEVLAFMVEQAQMSDHDAYSTFNMGAGFAVYCAAGSGERVARIAGDLGLPALVAGRVEDGPRQVVVEPVGVTFAGDEMDLTPDAQP